MLSHSSPVSFRRSRSVSGGLLDSPPKKWEKWLCALLYGLGFFGFYAFLFSAVALTVPTRFATMPARGLLLAVAGLVFALCISGHRPVYRGRMWLIVGGFWMLYALRVFADRHSPLLYDGVGNYIVFGFGGCFLPMLGFVIIFSKQAMRWAFWAVIGTGFVACAMSGWVYRGLFGGYYGRVKTGQIIDEYTSVSPLTLSYLASSFIVLGIYLFFERRNVKGGLIRFALPILVVTVGTVPLLLGASRGSLVAIAFASAVLLASRVNRMKDLLPVIMAAVVLVGLGGWLYFNASAVGSNLASRFLNIGSDMQVGASSADRLILYQMGIMQFFANPLLGSGLVLYPIGAYPHNLILESFMATGILGGALFSIFTGTCLWRSVLLLRSRTDIAWVAILFLHYFVYGQLSSSLTTNSFYWLSGAAVLAAYRSISQRNPVPDGRKVRTMGRLKR